MDIFKLKALIVISIVNRLGVIVLIDEILAQKSCDVTSRIKRNVQKIYIDERFLIKSIKDNKYYIEQVKSIGSKIIN